MNSLQNVFSSPYQVENELNDAYRGRLVVPSKNSLILEAKDAVAFILDLIKSYDAVVSKKEELVTKIYYLVALLHTLQGTYGLIFSDSVFLPRFFDKKRKVLEAHLHLYLKNAERGLTGFYAAIYHNSMMKQEIEIIDTWINKFL